jgi:eukaryotic-like serine/threonine-protein kinase
MTTTPTIDALFLAFQEAVAGRYSLERELGRGGMGVVYLARDVRLDRAVAIKLLPPELAAQPTLRERFLREARTAARLSHPYIVPIHAVDEAGAFVFYVMAYVNGETLSDRVRGRGPLPAADVSRILREVAWALAYAHAQGVVHRDIKPANILLEAGTNRALVTDFGIARVTNVSGDTSAGELLGTPEYMSPEQACGEQIDGRSDLYSLGIVGYFATTGSVPFSGSAREVLAQQITKQPPALASVAGGAPRSLSAAIDRCLAKEPAARYATGEELADALAANLDVKTEIPVPLRVFLERRTTAAMFIPPAIGAMLVPLLVQTLAHGGISFLTRAGVTLLMAGVFVGGPFAVVIQRLRKLMRAGYGGEDVANALRRMAERKREEFVYEFGPTRSLREKGLLGAGIVSASLATIAIVEMVLPGTSRVAPMLLLLSAYGTVISLGVSLKWHLNRSGKEPLLAKFWRSRGGRLLQRVAGIRLGQRAVVGDRPTELGIVMNAESLYSELPKETRKAIGDVPAVLKSLEVQAREMRARVTALDDSLADAQRSVTARASSIPGAARDLQGKLVEDLKSTRAAAEARHADIVTAMETLRLNLLRLRAGATRAESVTQDLAAAQALSEDVDRLLEGAGEVELALRKPHAS